MEDDAALDVGGKLRPGHSDVQVFDEVIPAREQFLKNKPGSRDVPAARAPSTLHLAMIFRGPETCIVGEMIHPVLDFCKLR